jgi:hypothetical protein
MSRISIKKLSPLASIGAAVSLLGGHDDIEIQLTPTPQPTLTVVKARTMGEALTSPWRHVGRLLHEAAQEVAPLGGARDRKKA